MTKAGRRAARRALELSFFVFFFFFFSSLTSDDDERQVWGRSREMPFLAGWLGWTGRIVGLADRGRRLLHIPPTLPVYRRFSIIIIIISSIITTISFSNFFLSGLRGPQKSSKSFSHLGPLFFADFFFAVIIWFWYPK